jgi:hypothetical protein
MNPEPEFLNLEDVLQIHDEQLTDGIRRYNVDVV